MTDRPSIVLPSGHSELSERERRVLEAVVRTYVDTAEPAGSRSVARRFHLGISPATVRNTMSDLEEKGYLFHPHASAGRIPTDLGYRAFVEQVMQPTSLTREERERLEIELDVGESSAVERLIRRATRALGLLSQELGVASAPRLEGAILDRLDLVRVSATRVLLVAQVRSGPVKTVFIDLPFEIPDDTLTTLTPLLNERLAGLTLKEIRETVHVRMRDAVRGDDPTTEEVLNIFMQSGGELFDWPEMESSEIHIGQASLLASQPEFTSGERLKGLLELTEKRDVLADILTRRSHVGGIHITIGAENRTHELADFTLVTAEYRVGGLKGVIGVIGPTRMPYEKVCAIVGHTSSLVGRMLE
ncbi:MAG: heat-inducible transcription repressor HrcA [Gemmatimonadetes bacterium]|nr:heat-inducible transcription repressor HrcA [Gemmatimonadota bacterium]